MQVDCSQLADQTTSYAVRYLQDSMASSSDMKVGGGQLGPRSLMADHRMSLATVELQQTVLVLVHVSQLRLTVHLSGARGRVDQLTERSLYIRGLSCNFIRDRG